MQNIIEDEMGGRKPLMVLLLTLGFVSSLFLGCASVKTMPTSISPMATSGLPTLNDLERAREVLTSYFSLLHDGRYSEAIHYYGGTYDILRDWNPDVDEDDYAALFKRGCTSNGLRCLRIKTIVRKEEVSPTEFTFTVEFINDDGTLFERGPCCGTEEKEPPQTLFPFTVKKVDGRLLVQEMPVYVP